MPRKGSYDQIEDVAKSTSNQGYFCRITPGECAYRLVEYNPDDQQKKNTLTSPAEQSQRRRANALHTGRQKRLHQQRIQVKSRTLSSSRFLMVRFTIASSFQKNKLVWRGKCYYIHLSRHPYSTEGNKV